MRNGNRIVRYAKGEEDETKKILLYQIDEQEKNVLFVETTDDESAWAAITDSDLIVRSFDEIFREFTEFRAGFLDYEQTADELLAELNQSGTKLRKMIKQFGDPRRKSGNFFTRYYVAAICEMFTQARADIDDAGPLRNTGAAKKAAGSVKRAFGGIRKVMRDDWGTEHEALAIRVPGDKIIIRGNDCSAVYSIAELSLRNFFADFMFVIYRLRLYPCECRYCGERYLGDKNSICCDAEKCQAAHAREVKNAKRRAHEKSPYRKPITTITNYLSQAMYTLRASVQNDPEILAVFREKREDFMQQIRDKVAEYEVEHRAPDDAEMQRFVAALEGEIGRLRTNLIEE